jgi:hypothetical protein
MSISIAVGFPGAIADYSDLVAVVADWLDRDDMEEQIPRCVALTEARLNRLLRVPEMETIRLQVTTSETFAVPDDFLAMRSIYLEGSPDRPLRAMSPAALAHEFGGSAGVPVAYAIRGRTVQLAPPPADETTASIDYYAKIPTLSDEIPTNWVLETHPDLYLYGTLMHVCAKVEDPEGVAKWKAAFDESVAELVGSGNRNRWGAGPLVPNSVRQVRGARC